MLKFMPNVVQVRGALLEEAVLFLLRKVGYQPYDPVALTAAHGEHMRIGPSGLEVRGRGTWHQLDAFALWQHSPAFMYPLRLMIEAKCHAPHRPVGVEVPRNSVGVLKDISENYFTYNGRGQKFRGPRFNYTAAIFSTSGFTQGAVEYAVAHQVFLVQYDNVPVIQPLIDAIRRFDDRCIGRTGKYAISAIRSYFRDCLAEPEADLSLPEVLTRLGEDLLRGPIATACAAIRGSYFGMLQGQWPLHLLRKEPLPERAFATDVVHCRVHGNTPSGWKFVPIDLQPGEPDWFELEFSLPPLVAELVEAHWSDAIAVAQLKQSYFSFIDLTGVIGGIRRNVRLELDRDWISRYVDAHRSRANRP